MSSPNEASVFLSSAGEGAVYFIICALANLPTSDRSGDSVDTSKSFEEYRLPATHFDWDAFISPPNTVSNDSELDSFVDHLDISDGVLEATMDAWSQMQQLPEDPLELYQQRLTDFGQGQFSSRDILEPTGMITAAGPVPHMQAQEQTLPRGYNLNGLEVNGLDSAMTRNISNHVFADPLRMADPNPPKLIKTNRSQMPRIPGSPRCQPSPTYTSMSSSTYDPSGGPVSEIGSFVSLLRKLSEADSELLQHKHTIPAVSKRGPSESLKQSSFNKDLSPSSEAADGRTFALDTTFQLTQKIVSIFNDISSLLPKVGPSQCLHNHGVADLKVQSYSNESSPISSISNPFQDQYMQCEHGYPYVESYGESTTMMLDQGSLLLMLSSYIRMIEVYEIIFAHVHWQRQQPPNMSACAVPLPPIMIDNFSPLDTTLHTSMVVHFALQALASLRKVIGRLSAHLAAKSSRDGLAIRHSAGEGLCEDGDGGGPYFGNSAHSTDVVGMTCKAVCLREKELIRTTKELCCPAADFVFGY